jgi:hypothetical protein
MSVTSRRRGRSCDKTSNLVSSETDNISSPFRTVQHLRPDVANALRRQLNSARRPLKWARRQWEPLDSNSIAIAPRTCFSGPCFQCPQPSHTALAEQLGVEHATERTALVHRHHVWPRLTVSDNVVQVGEELLDVPRMTETTEMRHLARPARHLVSGEEESKSGVLSTGGSALGQTMGSSTVPDVAAARSMQILVHPLRWPLSWASLSMASTDANQPQWREQSQGVCCAVALAPGRFVLC